ncbi:MAG: hypothetical protein NTZ56_02010 [Acidobacteria bacterium]|nr:hypothetical protein [Acidobacteriota bacterium]
MALKLQQEEHYQGNDYWSWEVWLDGSPDDLNQVEKVLYVLHRSFPNPVRETNDRASGFRLKSAGWGTFPLLVNVTLKNGREIHLTHDLQLHYPNGELTTA